MRVDVRELGAIFAGGCLGALARAGLLQALPHPPGDWPWATFLANLAGAALLGWAVTRLQERLPPSPYARPLIGTGLCGGITTFSTLQLDAFELLDAGRAGLAALYVGGTLAAGFAAVWASTAAARR